MSQLEKEAKHEQVVELIQNREYEKALSISIGLLNDDPDDPSALFQISKCMLDQEMMGMAHNLMARAVKMRPDIPEMWLQFGQTHGQTPEQWEKAEWCFKKAIKIGEEAGKDLKMAKSCIGTLHYLRGNYDKAIENLLPLVEGNPDAQQARSIMAFSLLAQQKWREGWEYYASLAETNRRETYAYGDEPEWDGTPGQRLIISGEQGIGDELMYASIFNQVMDDSPYVVIECMPRLEALFKRSFPEAKAVYGTRWDNHVVWEENHAPDAHVAMATLPRYYRNETEDFNGEPYLIPDPDIVDAVKGIFKKLGPNKKVGIAWTGGSDKTRGHLRTQTLENLAEMLKVPDIDFISLEYYKRDEEIAEFYENHGVPIHTYHWMTERGLDYDLTAGLISQLDLVISVPTTCVQAAGGLGVEVWCMVPEYTGWMFAQDTYPWADSVSPIHNSTPESLAVRLEGWMKKAKAA